MKEARVIIAGSRDFNDYEYLKEELTQFIANHPNRRFTIVSGAARGADRLGERFAREKNIPVKCFPAEWDKLGRGAGYIRNAQMLDYISQSDCEGYVIAFWDGKSKGTQHMIKTAQKAGVTVEIKFFQKIKVNSKKHIDKILELWYNSKCSQEKADKRSAILKTFNVNSTKNINRVVSIKPYEVCHNVQTINETVQFC